MVSITEYLINVGILISILYLTSFLHKQLLINLENRYKEIIFVMISIFSGWCSMFFGIHLSESVIFDLRFIPIIIAIVYSRNLLSILTIGIGIGLARFSFGITIAAQWALSIWCCFQLPEYFYSSSRRTGASQRKFYTQFLQ